MIMGGFLGVSNVSFLYIVGTCPQVPNVYCMLVWFSKLLHRSRLLPLLLFSLSIFATPVLSHFTHLCILYTNVFTIWCRLNSHCVATHASCIKYKSRSWKDVSEYLFLYFQGERSSAGWWASFSQWAQRNSWLQFNTALITYIILLCSY